MFCNQSGILYIVEACKKYWPPFHTFAFYDCVFRLTSIFFFSCNVDSICSINEQKEEEGEEEEGFANPVVYVPVTIVLLIALVITVCYCKFKK